MENLKRTPPTPSPPPHPSDRLADSPTRGKRGKKGKRTKDFRGKTPLKYTHKVLPREKVDEKANLFIKEIRALLEKKARKSMYNV